MRLLLDTNAWLWMEISSARLRPEVRLLLESGENALAVSIASYWEVAIKAGLGRLELGSSPAKFVADSIAVQGIEIEGITVDDVTVAGALPNHHGDPFDRMLIAQALNRAVPVVTSDERFAAYGVAVIRA